ncbi:hypothetical protein J8Z24_18655 [Pseudoalteromonas sp. SCSIO 43201]|uniref:hypothetical protein n=1 Tax=Pseudoalteromonas TaxID=53246 RepID=UPI002075A1C2|nr:MULTISPECIES: hypothetical protein [Pseudoalteromonas]MDW7549150.1 hypothetical protein [Pseudoalteromonas peptidolytica]USD30979.1 hypothetical protein J8Z24_18655 [Pseudoalteromonas sp. SCSIO 43201]
MIISIMSFFSIIPIWFATTLLYFASPKQRYLATSLKRSPSYAIAALLIFSGFYILTLQFPIVSAMLAVVVVLMSSLVSVTLLSAYPKRRFYLAATMVCAFSLLLGGIAYVA